MKANTMGTLTVNDKRQYLPVGFGTLSNIMPGLRENTITVIFNHDVPADYVDSKFFQEERGFRVVEQGSEPAPSGYHHIGHVTLKDGRLINVFAEPDNRNEPKKEVSMITVLREQLAVTPAIQSKMVGNSKIIHAAEDRQGLGRIDIWYEQRDDVFSPNPARNFVTLRTGEALHGNYQHVRTVQMKDGSFCHIYAEVVF